MPILDTSFLVDLLRGRGEALALPGGALRIGDKAVLRRSDGFFGSVNAFVNAFFGRSSEKMETARFRRLQSIFPSQKSLLSFISSSWMRTNRRVTGHGPLKTMARL